MREKFKTQREGNWTSSRPHVSDQASSIIGRNRAQKSSGTNSFIMNSNLEDDQGQTTLMDAKDLHLLFALPSNRFSLTQSDQDWEDTTSEAKIE